VEGAPLREAERENMAIRSGQLILRPPNPVPVTQNSRSEIGTWQDPVYTTPVATCKSKVQKRECKFSNLTKAFSGHMPCR
jgi:hypothetical protein